MNAFDYLQTLPQITIDRIYEDPWACQAVFQSLPDLAKQFTMRLLCIEQEIPEGKMRNWLSKDLQQKERFDQVLQKMKRQHVLQETSENRVRLNPIFQSKLKWALSSAGGSPWEKTRRQLPPPRKTIKPRHLERYARNRWDSVLHYMVGSTAVENPPASVVDILIRTKLMKPSADNRSLHITSSGYEFMLKDVHIQMWVFMLEYIKTLDSSQMASVRGEDILRFLFQLSYCQTNEYYAIADLTETQKLLLNDFIDFGLLYRSEASSSRFYTTSLAVNLIFGGSTDHVITPVSNPEVLDNRDDQSEPDLMIVVETNFKVYAYTKSALHVAMLSVFVDIVTRLPNIAVGFVTRESLRSAYINGISANQIFEFLMKHAHPRMRQNVPVIPENIADQLFLWEKERNRTSFSSAILFDGFNTIDDFNKVVDYADDLNALEWHDAVNSKLAISTHAENSVREFIKNSISNR